MTCTACGNENVAGNRYCGMCGRELGRPQSGRERRRVSVVFIDLAKFSTITHGLDPEEVRDLADQVLTAVAGVIEDFDGYVDAFRGDGLIALFGAPRSHPDDPLRAVLAAAKGLETIAEVGRARGIELAGRAGVNTGTVIAGAVGSGRVHSYTVMGSAVNLAARLEEAANSNEVWVGPDTYEATRHRLLFEPTGHIELNGFPNVQGAFRLVHAHSQPEVDPYAHLRFVGRHDELAALGAAFVRVAERGLPSELWLAGEAGRGKTRLLKEFVARLGTSAIALRIDHRPAAEFSWNPVAFQLFGLREGDEEHVAVHRVQSFLDRSLPGDSRAHRAILGSLSLAPLQTWTRLERRSVDRTNLAWRDLFAAVANGGDGVTGLVLVVEGEPRDRSLLEFLDLLTEATAPILVIRTSRDRSVPDGVEALHLPALTFEESLRLLDEVASPALRLAADALVRQVGGVPAYVLELGRALSITQEDSFSGSLASLLQARLDMVELKPRKLLAQAALVGEASWEGLLLELAGSSDPTEIRALTSENLLVKQPTSTIAGEVEYRFQSELLRNAVLRMIPFADRPQLHLRIATWIEQVEPLEFAELIATHFERGGSPDSAFDHFMSAADIALHERDERRCFELFERALSQAVPATQLARGAIAALRAAVTLGAQQRMTAALSRAEAALQACPEEEKRELQHAIDELGVRVTGLVGT
jgi:class 3 adenylate cyclase